MKSIKLKIEGLDCSSCAMNIDLDLEDLPGIKSASTNYAKELTEVKYDEKTVEVSQIIESVRNSGHKATVI